MTCSVCFETLNIFKEPKKLPCSHIYCKECLKGLILHSREAQFTCPVCRSKIEVPNDDVNSFPTAVFEVNRSTDIQGVIVDTKEKLLVGHESHVIIDLTTIALAGSVRKQFSFESSRIEAELISILDSSLGIKLGRVESVSRNRIKVTFTPRTRGKHKLIIKVDEAQIVNSPFMLKVTMPPKQMAEPLCTLVTGLEQPTSVIYSKEKVLATEKEGERVTEIDVDNLGHSLKSCSEFSRRLQVLLCNLNGVNGLAHDTGDILYVSTAHQVHKFSRNGRCVATVGCYGTGQAEFMHPSGLRVNNKGELYVCDSNNHRIQVFDLELNFKRSFGSQGTAPGQFCYPNNIAFDSNGQVYIADSMNYRIQCFTSKPECHLYNIEHKNLSSPTGLLIHNDHIYVTDYHNHKVMVMTLSGDVVVIIGSEHLKFPEGITMDEDGFLYVTSDHSNIVVF